MCKYSKVHDLPLAEEKLDDTGKLILRQHSYRHTKEHVGTRQRHKFHLRTHAHNERENTGLQSQKWLCIIM